MEDPKTCGVIVSELKLNKAASDVMYCFFRLKRELGKITDFISVKAWGPLAEGVVHFLKNGDEIEVTGHFMPELREREIVVIDEHGVRRAAALTEERTQITLRLNPAAKPSAALLSQCDRYILCKAFKKI